MIKAIVTDIEGTTSSLSFVKDVLFPYARRHLADYISAHRDAAQVRSQLDATRELMGGGTDDEVVAQLLRWIDEDKKITPLKALQGLIWEAGYRNGDFKGHIYEDAYRNLKKWHAAGVQLYVFSSGSVYAQRLLFGHTEYGDLTPLFAGYFDTNIGNKREVSAYERILAELQFPAATVLFLSDIKEELDAAADAGMKTIWLVRDAQPDSVGVHIQARSFDEINAM